MTHGQPIGDERAVDGLVCIRQHQESHAESSKVSPEQKIQGVKGVGPTVGVFVIVLSSKVAVWSKLNAAVVEEAIFVDLAAVHEPGEVGVPEGLLVKEVVPKVVGLWLAAEDDCHRVGQGIPQVSVGLVCSGA